MERLVSFAKDIFELLRDAALLALAGLLLLFPGRFNDMLVKAGFEEGSIVGFMWKAKLVEADQALNEAQATISQLRGQLDKASNALAEAGAGIPDERLKSTIYQIAEDSRRLTGASDEVEGSVKSTIASQASMVERALSAIGANGGWGVVLANHISLGAAQDDGAQASHNGIPSAAVYLRNGSFASVGFRRPRARASISREGEGLSRRRLRHLHGDLVPQCAAARRLLRMPAHGVDGVTGRRLEVVLASAGGRP